MSGFSIQSYGGVALPASPSALSIDRPATPASSSLPESQGASPSAAVSFDFSELAQALEKLAQTPGLDERALTQIIGLLKQQGELLHLATMLNASGGGPVSLPSDFLNQLDPSLAEALKAAFSQAVSGAPTASTAPQNPAAELQNRIAQSLQQFVASLKGAFVSTSSSTPQVPSTAPNASITAPQTSGQGSAATGAAALKAGVALFIQAQTDQFTSLFQALTGQLPGAPATGAPPSVSTLTPLPGAAAPGETSAPPAAEVADALRQLVTTGRLAASPLLRQEFIKATLGVVSTLLSEPAFSSSTAPSQGPGAPLPSAPGASASSASSTAPAPTESALPSLQDRAPALLQSLRGLAPLLTPSGREVLARVESLLGELAPNSPNAPTTASKNSQQLPERLTELARRGLTAELETLDLPRRLEPAVSALRGNGLRAETLRPDRSRPTLLRVTIPGDDPKAEPLRLAATGGREKARNAYSATGSATSPNPESSATNPSHLLKSSAALATPFSGSDRTDPESAPASDRLATPARHDQYTHPEAFRPAPQAQQEKAALHLAAFFQAHREEALQGAAFEPQAEESAIPARLLLTYRPIEVIRPGKGVRPFEPTPQPQPEAEPPIITIRPREVRKSHRQ